MQNKRVLLAMSGGVDSSACAILLKKQGYDVTGVTLNMILENENAIKDAKLVCKKLGIEHVVIEAEEIFKNKVINNFIETYANIETPNPCIQCNIYLKFGVLYDYMKNNNSGFTLVELLGVVVIIGILATVAGLAVFQIIHNQQEKLLEDQIATLKDTAVTYVLSEETYLESCGNALDTNNPDCYVNVSINDLIEEGFFENRGDICDTNKSVIVYKRTEGLITELESYVEDGVCSY